MRRKQNLASALGKRKLGGGGGGEPCFFSEIHVIKLLFWKKCHTLLCILALFRIIVSQSSLRNGAYPQFSFWIPIALAKICFFRIVINCAKILLCSVVGTVLEYLVIFTAVVGHNTKLLPTNDSTGYMLYT